MNYKSVTRKQWIEALKSGEYKQGVCYLRTREDDFCCLGVLCMLAGAEMHLHDAEYLVKTYDGDSWIGQTATMPSQAFLNTVGKLNLEHDNESGNLACLNDGGYTFEQIADLINFDSWARGLE